MIWCLAVASIFGLLALVSAQSIFWGSVVFLMGFWLAVKIEIRNEF